MKPQDRLPEIRTAEGAEKEPEVYLLTREDSRWAFSRRDVMSLVAGAAAARSGQAQSCTEGPRTHTSFVRSLAFTPDSSTLVSLANDHTIKYWRMPLGTHLKTITLKSLNNWSMTISPDGQRLVLANGGRLIELRSFPDGDELPGWEGHTDLVYALGFSPDGRWLASGGWDSKVRLWSWPEGRLVKTLSTIGWVEQIAFSPDGELVAAWTRSERVYVWSCPEGRELNRMDESTAVVAFTPDGQALITGGKDLRLWSLPGKTLLQTLQGHESSVKNVGFALDGRLMISASYDRTVRLWSMPDGGPVKTLTGHTSMIEAMAISPDGRLLATGGYDNTIRVWRLPDGEPLGCLTDLAIAGCACVGYTGGGGGGGGGICTCIPVVYRYPN